jgi:hypothetical protein
LSRIFCTGLISGTNGPLEPVLMSIFRLVYGGRGRGGRYGSNRGRFDRGGGHSDTLTNNLMINAAGANKEGSTSGANE